MAGISSTVDFRDPLGAPTVVTGPQYLDALSRLGYNVENMSSPLPMMAKNAALASNLITGVYDQQLNWQKEQANTAEAMARANNLDSVTDFNNQSLQTRLARLDLENKGMDLKNKMDQNRLTFDNATMDSAIRAEVARGEQADILTKSDQLKLDQAQRGADDSRQALDDIDKAISDIPQADDPDFDGKLAKAFKDHNLAATNQATSARWGDAVGLVQNQRKGIASVQLRAKNIGDLQDRLNTGDIPSSIAPKLDQIAQDPDLTHAWNARGNLSRVNKQITSILATLKADDAVPSKQLNDYITTLTGAQTRINNMLRDDNLAGNLAKGVHSQDFDADGNLNPELKGELDALSEYNAERLKQGLGKAPTAKVTVLGPRDPTDYLGTGKRDEIQVDVPLDQVDKVKGLRDKFYQDDQAKQDEAVLEQKRQEILKQAGVQQSTDWWWGGPAQGSWLARTFGGGQPAAPATEQDPATRIAAAQIHALIQGEPAMREVLRKALEGSPAEKQQAWATVRARLAGVPGLQYGGMIGTRPGLAKQAGGVIFNPASVGAGAIPSTDTVPAMLTPGEYVVNRDAVDAVGKGTLDQINQAGRGVSSTPGITNPLAAMARQIGQPQQAANRPPVGTQTASAQPAVKPWWGTATKPGTTEPETAQPGTTDQTQASGVAPAAAVAATRAAQPSQVEPSTPIGGAGGSWKSGIGSEFGEVDNPAYGGYTESNWNKGKWGDTISGWDTEGVALPNVPHGTVVEVMNPKTGQTTRTTVKDSGPGAGTGAAIDLLAGTRAKLGLPRDFKGPVQFRIVSSPTAQMQHGGLVSEEGSIGTGPGRGAGGGAGGIESRLDQPVDPRQRHRRFHPRMGAAGGLGGLGPDIPDPMQKKLAKLSQGYLSGISDLIRQNPDMGPALLHHARRQLAANMGGQPEDWMGMSGGSEGEQPQGRQQQPVPPEAYGGGMLAYGGSEGEQPAYMQYGGAVDPNFVDPFTAMMDTTGGGGPVPYQKGGQVQAPSRGSPTPLYPPYGPDPGLHSNAPMPWIYNTDPTQPGWQPGIVPPVIPPTAPWDPLTMLAKSQSQLTNLLAQRST